MGFLYAGEVSRRRDSPVGYWTLGLVMCSMRISRMNWNSVVDPRLASESAWFFSDLGTDLKSHWGILDLNLRSSCRYSTIWESLAIYSLLTWLTISEESHENLSPVTPSVIVARSPAITASYSASLLKAGKPRLKDCLKWILLEWWDNFDAYHLLFEALSAFRIHPSSRSTCFVAPGVKSAIKSAKTWPLITALGSHLSP